MGEKTMSTLRTRTLSIARILIAISTLAALTTCDLFKAGLGSKIDVSAPSVDVSTLQNGDYISSATTLAGTAGDDVQVSGVSVSIYAGSTLVAKLPAAIDGKSWSVVLDPMALFPNMEAQADLNIQVSDNAGKTTDRKLVLYFDTVRPAMNSLNPSIDNLMKADNFLSETVLFEGSVKDGFGVESVTLTAGGVSQTSSSGSWSFFVDTTAFAAGSGGVVDLGGGVLRVPLTIGATDKAGNASLPAAGYFFVDQNRSAPWIVGPRAEFFDHAFDSGGTTIIAPGEQMTFRITDAECIDPSTIEIVISDPSGQVSPDFTYSVAGGNLTLNAIQEDGLRLLKAEAVITLPVAIALAPKGLGEYSLDIRASDDADFKYPLGSGVAAERLYEGISLTISNAIPTVYVASPLNGAVVQELNLAGTIDDGYGVDSVSISVDGGDPEPATLASSGTGVLNATWTYAPAAALTEGSHTIDVFGYNVGGKQSALVQRQVVIDTTDPTINVIVPGASSPQNASPLPVRGFVEDEGGVQVVRYLAADTGIDHSLDDPSAWPLASGTVSWTGSVDLASMGEGAKTLWVAARDKAGNWSANTATNFYYDLASPILSETTVGTTDTVYRSADFSFGGTWTESNGLSTIEISCKKDGGAASTVAATLSPAAAGTDVEWNATIDVDTDNTGTGDTTGIQDGSYLFTILATDAAGRTASSTRTVVIDTTVPIVTPPAPSASYVATTVSLSGSASDPGLTASKVQSVEWSLDESAWTAAVGMTSWTAAVDLSAAAEVDTLVYFRARDNAGLYSPTASTTIRIDHNAPRATMSPTGNFVTVATVQSTRLPFTLGGFADDAQFTDGRAASSAILSYSKDGGAPTDVTLTPVADEDDWIWSWSSDDASLTNGSNDGLYEFTLTVNDAAGKVSTSKQVIRVDTTAPTVVIDAPALGAIATTNVDCAISGSARDTGGVGFDGAAYGTVDSQYSFNGTVWTDLAALTSTTNWSAVVADLGSAEGALTLHVRAMDRLGNEGQSSVLFYYDMAKPVISETAVGSGTVYKIADFNFGGNWTESNRLSEIVITSGDYERTITVDASGTGQSWSYAVDLDDFAADGSYDFTIVATDIAGRTATLTRTVIIDRADPQLGAAISVAGTSFTGTGGTYYDGTLTFSGSASDDFGIKSVQYSLDGTTWVGATGTADWTVSLDSSAWSEGVSRTLSFKAIDNANRESAVSTEIIQSDHAPARATLGATAGTFTTVSSVQTTRAAFTLGGTADDSGFTGSRAAYSSVLSYTRDGAGATSVILTPDAATGAWSWDSSSASLTDGAHDGLYAFTLTVVDYAGRTSTASWTARVDATAPVLSGIADIGLAWRNSATQTVSGTINEDGSGIASVKYGVSASGAIEPASWSIFTIADGEFSGNVSFSEGNGNWLWIYAADSVGNESPRAAYRQNVWIDTNLPTASITSPGTSPYTNGASGSSINVTVAGSDDAGGSGATMAYYKLGSSGAWSAGSALSAGSATLPVSLETVTASTTIYVRVRDAANNYSASMPLNVIYDAAPPTVTISAPLVSNPINKVISISGTAYDEVLLDSSSGTLEVRTAGGAWNAAVTGTVGGTTSSWTVTGFDTSLYDSSTYDCDGSSLNVQLKLRYAMKDAAGNTGYNPDYTITIDQNSDRPLIKVTTISADGGTLKYGTNSQIGGTLVDDDGTSAAVVKDFIASGTAITSLSDTPSGTTAFDAATGDWTYTPAVTEDGLKTVYFYVVDNKDAVFYTGQGLLAEPYIQFKSGAKADNSAAITYKSDSNSPSIKSEGGSYGSSAALGTDVSNLTVDLCLGGADRRYMQFRATADDANGIQYMTMDVTDSSSAKIASIVTSSAYDAVRAESGTFSPTTDGALATWTTATYDLGAYATGFVTLTVTAYDQCGLYSNMTSTFYLDNAGPSVKVLSPLSSDEVTGEITVTGTTSDGGNAGVASIAWMFPTVAQQAQGDAALSELATWQESMPAYATATAWEFEFDGSDSITNPLLTAYDSENESGDIYYSAVAGGIYTLPLYFKASDNLGNYTIYRSYTLKHNPDGDKPVTRISYPSTDDYDAGKDFITLGGTIRVSGTATDNVSVSRVYLQVDWDGDGSFTAADQAYVSLSGYYSTTLASYASSGISSGVDAADQASWWGIRANNASGWSLNLNSNGELDPDATFHIPGNEDLRDIRIRACSVDNNDKAGAWTDYVAIRLDDKAPMVGSSVQQINRYADGTTLADFTAGSVPAAADSADYLSDMYLKGQWYLVASLEDESGIGAYSVKKGAATLAEGTGYKAFAATWASTSGYTLYIPIDTATDGSVQYTLRAEDLDSTSHTTEMTYEVNIDNTAPTFASLLGNGSIISSSTPVQNSNYRYTLASDATDSGSGFKRAAFYFYRDLEGSATGQNRRIYDPMKNYSTAPASSRVDVRDSSGAVIGGITEDTLTSGAETYYLYGATMARTGGSDTETTFTSTGLGSNIHVRAGGLIKIGGQYRRITAISGDTASFEPATPTSNASAFFPYAQVADNTAAENVTWSGGIYSFTGAEDGDGMPESVSKSSTTWSWDATLYSTYMPDGPITIVCFVFDAAGNISAASVTTTVENNPPRLSKLYLGTDLNGDSKYSDAEFEAYDLYHVSGAYQSSYTLTTAGYSTVSGVVVSPSARGAFTIKDGLAVAPEFVGGNNTINVVYTRDASSVTSKQTGTVTAPSPGATYLDVANTMVPQSSIVYALSNEALTGTASYSETEDGEGKAMAFTFWDSTDETSSGTSSQSAFLKVVDFKLDLVDGNIPKAMVSPFYIDDAGTVYDNSLYLNSWRNGHLELLGELPSGTFSSSNTGVYDLDPKVSGRISVRGSAYDDRRLDSIWICFDGFTPAAGSYIGSSSADFGDSMTYYKLASFAPAGKVWSYATGQTVAQQMSNYNFAFTVTPDYFSQDGHSVNWELDIDTSKILGASAADARVRVVSLDHRITNQSDVESVTADNVPYLQMDVVPYIYKVETALSKLKKNNWSVFNRTALGHYPVSDAATESVIFHGFNLAGAQYSGTDLTIGSSTDADGYTFTTATMPASLVGASGGLSLTNAAGTVGTLNNENSNSVAHNKQANGDNNANLTDDVVMDVWTINATAAQPRSGKVTEPVMRINPSTGLVGFAFANGPDSFSMGSGTANSYQWWQYNYDDFAGVAMVYDSNGRSHGIAIGRDMNANTDGGYAGRMTYMTSKWGRNETTAGSNYYNLSHENFNGYKKIRLESVGLPAGLYYNGAATPASTYTLDKTRFRSPSLAVAAHAGGEAVYLAYYDSLNDQLRFRYGSNDLANKTTAANFGQFIDATGYSNGSTTSGTLAIASGSGDWSAHRAFETQTSSYSLIAGRQYNPTVANTLINDTGNTASEYVAIDVIPGADMTADVVVIVWYDGTDLKYVYRYGTKDDTDAGSAAVAGRWSEPITVFTEMGKHCAIAADVNGGVHIAAYDSMGGDLKYAYLSDYDPLDEDFSMKTCTVDSYGIVGDNISIDTALNSSNVAVPYISYYMASTGKPKIAYPVSPDYSQPALAGGVNEDDSFTGSWEISLVPTSSAVCDDRVNVGVWKSAEAGTIGQRIANPLTGMSAPGTTSGMCYGNSTANPILGYATESGTKGYIETAQMK